MAYGKTLISIVGPTGSGKTDLSIAVAQHYSAPIISTDSRQFYRGIPIGTAQPDNEQLTLVEHHFIASHEITDDFNCRAYEAAAIQRLEELFSRHNIVVAVGGSGLYIKALCEGMDAMPEADAELRESLTNQLQQSGLEPLVERLRLLDQKTYTTIDRKNPARVLRALEICLATGRPCSELRTGERHKRDFQIVKIGVEMDRDILYDRINRRVDIMMEQGLEAEARSVEHLRNYNSLQTVGYREMFNYFDGKTTLNEAVELIKRNSRRYAKRQMTWFRRDDEIAWFHPSKLNEIVDYIESKICTLK